MIRKIYNKRIIDLIFKIWSSLDYYSIVESFIGEKIEDEINLIQVIRRTNLITQSSDKCSIILFITLVIIFKMFILDLDSCCDNSIGMSFIYCSL